MPNLMEKWDYAAQNNTPLRCELRLKKPWRGANGESDYTSIIAEASPELDSEGNVRYWIGVATNISHLKYVERIQLQRVQEAEEAKRQQELSIDTTSHELRNPLGAVLHCADAILGSLTDMRQLLDTDDSSMSPKARSDLLEIYTSSVDAANTIISCSNHQKRIVDDVLTWSKLNSHLLEISPSLISIRSFLQDIRNMFEIDAQKVGVKLVVQRHPSIAHTGAADYLVLDPGRTNQVVGALLFFFSFLLPSARTPPKIELGTHRSTVDKDIHVGRKGSETRSSPQTLSYVKMLIADSNARSSILSPTP